jgi:hypothetical protein
MIILERAMLSSDPLLIKFCFAELERYNVFPTSVIPNDNHHQRNLWSCLYQHTDDTDTEGLWAMIECILKHKPKNIKLFEKMIAKIVYRMSYIPLINSKKYPAFREERVGTCVFGGNVSFASYIQVSQHASSIKACFENN